MSAVSALFGSSVMGSWRTGIRLYTGGAGGTQGTEGREAGNVRVMLDEPGG